MNKPTVAVFGLHGNLGAATLAAFSDPSFSGLFNLPVKAVTRDFSVKKPSEFVTYVQGDISIDRESLIEKLGQVDIVISLLGATPEVLGYMEPIVLAIKPRVYIPSQFGMDTPLANKVFPGIVGFKTAHSEKIRMSGVKVVDIYTSLFAGGPWLRYVVGQVGIDSENNSVTYLGSPDTKFSYSTLDDIGRVVVSTASRAAANPNSFPNTLRVQSGVVSPAEVVRIYEDNNNVKLEVKQIIRREQVLEDSRDIWARGFDMSKFLYYLNVLISQDENGGLHFAKNDNELVNPSESLWKWEKI